MTSLRSMAPAERLAAIADPDSVVRFSAAGASPHLARYGISARDDDGVLTARARVHGLPLLIAAQDETFLGGSIGTRHAAALAALFDRARVERPPAIVMLVASGGVRLQEANPAELALARALAALLDARAAGVPVLALGAADVFGGASVVAAAADRLALLPQTRFGVSGPKVVEAAAGKAELDASDDAAVRTVFGAAARAAAGLVDLVADDADVVRSWIATSIRAALPFSDAIAAMHARLAVRLTDIRRDEAFAALPSAVPAFAEAKRVDAAGALWKLRDSDIYLTRPSGAVAFGPASAWALDDALLARMRARGHHVIGLLAGTGAGAAFFANALQGAPLYALEGARVVAMAPQAISRVTGLDAAALAARIESDPLVGHPVRQFASWGGVAGMLAVADR